MVGWWDRMRLAKQALLTPYSVEAGSQAAQILGGVISPGRGEPPVRNTMARLDAYGESPWLRAFGERIAADVASCAWELFLPRSEQGQPIQNRLLRRAAPPQRKQWIASRRKDARQGGDLEPVESHPLLDLVMDRGNMLLPGLLMRKIVQVHLDLTGEAFCVKERDALQTVVALWPVPPHWILGTPSLAQPVYRVAYRGWQQDVPATEMLAFLNPHPVNPYGRGSGLAGALGDEIDTDEYASKFVKQFFFNDATPPFMIFPKGTGTDPGGPMSETEAKRLEISWLNKAQGLFRAHRPLFPSREVGVYEFGKNLQQLQLKELRQQQRDTIMQVFGIPPEIMGVISNSNRATIESAEYLYAKHVLVPRLELLRSYFQERLVPEYDDRFILDYVTPVQEDHEFELTAMTKAPYAFTIDEWRHRAGESPLPDGAGQTYAVPINIAFQRQLDVPLEPPAPHPADEVVPPAA